MLVDIARSNLWHSLDCPAHDTSDLFVRRRLDLIERKVNGVLADITAQAEALFTKRFAEITRDQLWPEQGMR